MQILRDNQIEVPSICSKLRKPIVRHSTFHKRNLATVYLKRSKMVVAVGEDGGVKSRSSFVLQNINDLHSENLSTTG